jgi:hypothetical protein
MREMSPELYEVVEGSDASRGLRQLCLPDAYAASHQ